MEIFQFNSADNSKVFIMSFIVLMCRQYLQQQMKIFIYGILQGENINTHQISKVILHIQYIQIFKHKHYYFLNYLKSTWGIDCLYKVNSLKFIHLIIYFREDKQGLLDNCRGKISVFITFEAFWRFFINETWVLVQRIP